MHSSAKNATEYLAGLPPDRKRDIAALRKLILKNLPKGYEECISFGMLAYVIPLRAYPNTYNNEPLGIAGLASQKHYMSLYLMCVYGNPGIHDWFVKAFKASGKKLNMGKSCVRFKKLDDLPLDVIAQAVARVTPEQLIAFYETVKPPKKPVKRSKKK
jgi:hypothetical protein